MLLGEVGGMTRIERVKDKEMDEAGREAVGEGDNANEEK